MKRSMKQFKIDKRMKNRKQQPSFILDSVSIKDRLTTQPEVLKTQPSVLDSAGNGHEIHLKNSTHGERSNR